MKEKRNDYVCATTFLSHVRIYETSGCIQLHSYEIKTIDFVFYDEHILDYLKMKEHNE